MKTSIEQAKIASAFKSELGLSSLKKRNEALENIAQDLITHKDYILKANAIDYSNAKEKGISDSLLDRIALTDSRIEGMAHGVRQVIQLQDPVHQVLMSKELENGLIIKKVSVPLGLIGIIYEARPNVTVDCAVLCLKSGNCCILKSGKEAYHSSLAIVEIMQAAIEKAGINKNCIQLIEDNSHENTEKMMKCNEFIDVLIPRGSARLIQTVIQNSTVPVIETGAGNCHLFIDETANLDIAIPILINAKTQRPSVCNSIECCLIHSNIAKDFLNLALYALQEKGVAMVGCERVHALYPDITLAIEEDWKTEYLDLKISLKIVDSVDEAISHIQKYSTHHSESILSEDCENVQKFFNEIDSAVLYHNASTRFTDGFEFGLGAEIGISTQKLHARGPMGLEALTSYKYLIDGKGQIR